MKYSINYSVMCNKGLLRKVNQDNFWCIKKYLPLEHEGLEGSLCGKESIANTPCLAVFDGMGGEASGEVASFIATRVFDECYDKFNLGKDDNGLFYACFEMNNAICNYAETNGLPTMGTTAAIILFRKDKIFICNLGDSPIFKLENAELIQISTDHVLENYGRRKSPLTQFLGVPESEFVIQPFVAKGDYKVGDKYLICSDGLTDMVSQEEIARIISSVPNVDIATQMLMKRALEEGGKDNITIILCEICDNYKKQRK